jgi:hypothetical protein
MSISNHNGKRRKPFFALRGGTGVFIVVVMLLAGSSGFFALTISITSMTTALAQEVENNTTTVTPTRPSNARNTTTSAPSSEIQLSPQPIYQEHVRDVSETLINQTHAQLVVEGNGTLTLPNGSETIKTISTGAGIVSIFSTFAGKEVISTEDGSENATAISYEIARSNKEQGIGKGISIAIIHTNSTGRLAPLDGMILVGQEEFQPDGRALLTYWEWQSGIPLLTTTATTTNIEDPNL